MSNIVHYIWMGNLDTYTKEKACQIGAKSLAEKDSEIEINFWVPESLEEKAEYLFSDYANIQVKSVNEMLSKELNHIEKYREQIIEELNFMEEDGAYVAQKDLLSLVVLAEYGGYYFDCTTEFTDVPDLPPAEYFKFPIVTMAGPDIWAFSSNANNSSIINVLEKELEKGWKSDFGKNSRLEWKKTGKLFFPFEKEVSFLLKNSNLDHVWEASYLEDGGPCVLEELHLIKYHTGFWRREEDVLPENNPWDKKCYDIFEELDLLPPFSASSEEDLPNEINSSLEVIENMDQSERSLQAELKEYQEDFLEIKLLELDVFIRSYNFNRGNNRFAKGRTPSAKAMCDIIADDTKDIFGKWEEVFIIGREADLRETQKRSTKTALFYSYFRSTDDLFSALDSSPDVQNYRSENPEIYFREPVSIRADIMARSKGFLNSIDPELIFKIGDSYVKCGKLLQNYTETGSYQNLYMAFYTIFNQIPDFENDFLQMESISQSVWTDEEAAQNFVEIFRDTISCLNDSGFCEETQIELLNSILNLVEMEIMEIKASAAYDTAEQTKSDGNFFWS